MSDDIHGDNLANDLVEILKASRDQDNEVNENTALEKLTMYIVKRDHRVWQAGYDIGHGKGTGNLEPEEEG